MAVVASPPISLADVRSAVSDEAWSVDELLAELALSERGRPFDDAAATFCERLSEALMTARHEPQAVALGYWLRRASVARAHEALMRLESATTVVVPRGLVFHVAPANVDTVFAYSWLVSLLAGNANIVRLSSRSTDLQSRVLDVVASTLARPGCEAIRQRNRLVHTAHDERVSRAICAVADVRVIWGGDETVQHFRSLPMAPRGREVTFPDRHSMAILDAEAVAATGEDELDRLADRFFSDAFWYDQGACSSPRLLIWRSRAPGDATTAHARHRFHDAVGRAVERRAYTAQTGMAIAKLSFALARAAAVDGLHIETASNELTWVTLPGIAAYDRDSCGGGIFFEVESIDLASDLAGMVTLRDQTAVCFGLTPDSVRGLALALNGRGIDRFVSIGRALEFGMVWDGYDLLAEFTKRVVTDVGA